MFANFLIGLREGLEAALIVSILIAYVVKSGRRGLLAPIWTGVAIAVALSLGFGALLTFGPRGLTFEAQEMIGGGLSIIAVGFVTWMIFWMLSASKDMAGTLRSHVDRAGEAGMWSLVLMAMLAVGREGLETTLFLWAAGQAATGGGAGSSDPIIGAALGIAVAVAIGYLLYRGAITINLSRFFAWTGAFLIVVAAGVLAYGIHDLQEAGVLPGLNDLLFDVSATIEPGSWYGTLLKGVFNFSPATTYLEALAWITYMVCVGGAFAWRLGRRPHRGPDARPATNATTEGTVS